MSIMREPTDIAEVHAIGPTRVEKFLPVAVEAARSSALGRRDRDAALSAAVAGLMEADAVADPGCDDRRFRGLARTCAARRIVDATRRRARQPRSSEGIESVADAGRTDAQRIDDDERFEHLVSMAPPGDREILRLIFRDGESHKEVRGRMGMSKYVMRRRLDAALGMIRSWVEREMREGLW